MNHQDQSRHGTLLAGRPAGPAGTATAPIGLGIIADVDVADGEVLTMQSVAPGLIETAAAVIHRIVADDASRDSVRRLVFASSFAADEGPSRAHWWALDRVRARIELERAFPELEMPFSDPDLDVVFEALVTDRYELTDRNASALELALAAFYEKTSTSQRAIEPALGGMLGPITRDVPVGDEAAPRLVSMSAGADLANAVTGGGAVSCVYDRGIVTLRIPMSDPDHWVPLVDLYLVEPDHDQPVAGIARPAVGGDDVVEAQFIVAGEPDRTRYELVILPHKSSPRLCAPAARAIAHAEIQVRTAVRLAHKRTLTQTALARLHTARAALAEAPARVQDHYRSRLDLIEETIRRGDGDSGLLADM